MYIELSGFYQSKGFIRDRLGCIYTEQGGSIEANPDNRIKYPSDRRDLRLIFSGYRVPFEINHDNTGLDFSANFFLHPELKLKASDGNHQTRGVKQRELPSNRFDDNGYLNIVNFKVLPFNQTYFDQENYPAQVLVEFVRREKRVCRANTLMTLYIEVCNRPYTR